MLARVVRGLQRRLDRLLPQEPPITERPVERFVFSEEASQLSDEEYRKALGIVERIKALIAKRDALPEGISHPGSNWDRSKKQIAELDGSTTNPFTSSDLVLSGDRDIIRKLRLYAQAFSGYQLATLQHGEYRPWIRSRLPDNLDSFLALIVSKPDPYSLRIPAIYQALPEKLRIGPPARMGEIGWLVDGRIHNYDTFSYLQEICLMHENGVLDAVQSSRGGVARVLELGSGYGGLAYYLTKILGNVRYVAVDLPESLVFAAIYLSTLFPDLRNEIDEPVPETPGFSFLPNFSMDQVSGKYDLVINTLSLYEMKREQIVDYCQRLRGLLKPGGVFFEHNFNSYPGQVESLEDLIRANLSTNCTHCKTSILGPSMFRGQARVWRI